MPTRSSSTSRRTAGLAGLGLLSAGLVALPLTTAAATPAGDGLVISEVFGGGGNSGATLTHDFIELHNPTSAPIDVDGLSVQYRSATGTAAQVTPLAGEVPAGGHYLVQQAQGSGGSQSLPTPDATGDVAMSGSNGVVLLVPGTAPYSGTGDLAGSSDVLDAVGYGTTPTTYEGARTGVALTSTTSAARSAAGADTDHNADDFAEGGPTPQGSGQAPPEEPTEPDTLTIAEIQGTGATSPVAGDTVTTSGLVTAAYPDGGFNGFYIQTPGTGGQPGEASHGLFVYGWAATQQVAVGDHVRVTGEVSEYQGLTEITPAGASDVEVVPEAAPAPVPVATTWPGDDAGREQLEGMLMAPTGDFTVTDNYSLNNYAEIGIAQGTEPLRQPTDVAPHGSVEAEAEAAHNDAARVTLDDGASINFLGADRNKDIPLPWLTDDPTIRVGEPVTFERPVVVDYRYGLWRLQPTGQLTAGDSDGVLPATFGDTRTAAPEAVGGDLQVASFNVLNYFTTTGSDWVAAGNGTCSYYRDRDGDPVGNNRCEPDGPRGAAEQEDLERQQAKIVSAINSLDAEVVSLEEIENSAQFGKDRDRAMADLVAALNADLGEERWSFVPSPEATPAPEREDVIRTGFIYVREAVKAQGDSFIHDGEEFDNARDPLAQVFKPVGGDSSDKFLLVVNHFKSKGSAPSDPDDPNADHGQGGWNALRTTQAEALVEWTDELKAQTGVAKVYLDGDFNSYTFEDPMQVLHDAGYVSLEQRFDTEATYLFGGLVGSLDHALANRAALGTTTDATVWNINSVESVALEYSRHNYNATDFYEVSPYRSSDHDPVVFGVDVQGGPGRR